MKAKLFAYVIVNGVVGEPMKCNYLVTSQKQINQIREELIIKHSKDRKEQYHDDKYANDFHIYFHIKKPIGCNFHS